MAAYSWHGVETQVFAFKTEFTIMVRPPWLDRVFAEVLLPEVNLFVKQSLHLSPFSKTPHFFLFTILFFVHIMFGIHRDFE